MNFFDRNKISKLVHDEMCIKKKNRIQLHLMVVLCAAPSARTFLGDMDQIHRSLIRHFRRFETDKVVIELGYKIFHDILNTCTTT
ncbi:hypothetical protein Sjap_025326 [Stephania japonica]|uniref:Uncharacterized protein n=1 Tax=Stephania japonica TaxID=461633 RepID=A0AAP0HJH3_9MAGN